MTRSYLRFAGTGSASIFQRRRQAQQCRRKPLPLAVQSLEPRLALSAVGFRALALASSTDSIAPEVRSITPPKSQVYTAGQTLSFKVNFTERVDVSGSPLLPIKIHDTVRHAVWNGKANGGKALVFTTTVQSGDFAPAGVQVSGPIVLEPFGDIRDKTGNPLNPAASGVFPKATVDAVAPRVVEFSDPTITPKMISLRVTFTEPVAVKGKPTIPFVLAGSSKQLEYSRGSATNVLTFSYKPAKGEAPTAANVFVPNQAILLGSARIADRVANVATTLAQPDVRIQRVRVTDKVNATDTTGFGSVAYEYRIGTYETTIGQYTTFLNAVAKTDMYDLYNSFMRTNLNIAGISRSGMPGSYTYTVMNNGGDSSNRPITFVSWFDAARFANWVHNGQPAGAQNATTTEDGAYTLDGVTSGTAPPRNAGARFYIPTENEWYKAAYYSPLLNSETGGYYEYATQSNSAPDNTIGSGANQANYFAGDYTVTQSSTYSSSQNYLTNVGAFTNSASYYGTYDQTGNVHEWNDLTGVAGSSRGFRGGSWGDDAFDLSSSRRLTDDPSNEYYYIGFRLASPG